MKWTKTSQNEIFLLQREYVIRTMHLTHHTRIDTILRNHGMTNELDSSGSKPDMPKHNIDQLNCQLFLNRVENYK